MATANAKLSQLPEVQRTGFTSLLCKIITAESITDLERPMNECTGVINSDSLAVLHEPKNKKTNKKNKQTKTCGRV